MRKENQRRTKLDRKDKDSFGVSTEQEEAVEGPTRFAGKNARGHPYTKDKNRFVC